MSKFRFTSLFLKLITISSVFDLINSLGLLEPNDGQVYLGAWLDPSKPFYDTPADFNKRIGQNAYAFQFAQTIPVTPYSYKDGTGGPMNQTLIEQSGTSASIVLTVYPIDLDQIQDSDLLDLAHQIQSYQSQPFNRQVFLRYGPEMQGNWMPYGGRPISFVNQWKRMYTTIKSIVPNTVIVWGPNAAMGYPYGITYGSIKSSSDQLALDTNRNGQLDSGDDAYAPYYPGDDFVDWNGISWYWKGSVFPYTVNQVQPNGYSMGAMTGTSPAHSIGTSPNPETFTGFYDTYCKAKPCMFSEMGAAFHSNTSSGAGPGQLAIQTAWWQDTLTSTTFMDRFPKMKMFMLFEQSKPEDGGDLRDFRLTADSDVRTHFLNDLSTVNSRYVWAHQQPISLTGIKPPSSSRPSGSSFPTPTKGPNSIFRNHGSHDLDLKLVSVHLFTILVVSSFILG